MRCQECGTEWEPSSGSSQCPTCAQSPSPFDAGEAWQDGHRVAEGPGIPWEQERSFNAALETMKVVALSPGATFARAESDPPDGLLHALGYYVLLGTIFGALGQLLYMGLGALLPGSLFGGVGGLEALFLAGAGTGVMMVISVLVLPLVCVIGAFFSAALYHVCLMLVGGANAPFVDTFRVVCYAMGSVAPCQIVPLIGPFIAAIWALVINCLGLALMHDIPLGKAILAALLPVIVCCGCGIVAWFVIFAAAVGVS